MKEIVFIIKRVNWSMIGPNDWTDTEWTIYSDLSVMRKDSYNSVDKNSEVKEFSFTEEQYNELLNNIKLAKKNMINIEAYDGEAWGITEYHNGKQTWKRREDYIYSIDCLEKIKNILMKLKYEE